MALKASHKALENAQKVAKLEKELAEKEEMLAEAEAETEAKPVKIELTPAQIAKNKEEEEKARMRAARKKYEEMNKKRIKVKFTNIESPGVDVNFNYQGFEYWLHDGEEYNLPTYVVDHLNRLAVPKYEERINESGVPEHVQVGSYNRFSVVPLNMGDLTKG